MNRFIDWLIDLLRKNKNKNGKAKHGSMLSMLGLLISITLLGWTVYDLQLKNRPYLYITPVVENVFNYSLPNNPTNSKVRISIILKNVGNIPASDIKIKWNIRDDYGTRPTPDEFYKAEGKKMPEYKTVFPGQEALWPMYQPDISPATKKVIVDARVYYTGMSKQFWIIGKPKQYWYDYKSEYEVYYNTDGRIEGYSRTYFFTDWDKSI